MSFDDIGEPLRWSMHGGPGTGKTHVIKIIKEELFGKILGWHIGMEYNIVALQAVMADLLEGDTIHHAFNMPVYGRHVSTRPIEQGSRKYIEHLKTVLEYRWLVIDDKYGQCNVVSGSRHEIEKSRTRR